MSTAPAAAEQLFLFDVGVDISRLRLAQEDFLSAAQAKNTRSAYASSWRCWCAWCEDAGREPFPSNPESVGLFVAWCLREKGYRLATVSGHLSAIRSYHLRRREDSPVDESVRRLLHSAARRLRERPGGKAALSPEHVREISRRIEGDGSRLSIRNRAILLLGFASGMRRSEIAGLALSDVRFVRRGLIVQLGATKTDQAGREGRVVAIMPGRRRVTDPVAALREWLSVRGRWPGPLFTRLTSGHVVTRQAISGDVVRLAVKAGLERIGEDPSAYGAHSLRAGMATAAAEHGAPDSSIMQRGGWRSHRTFLRYVRPARAFAHDAMAGVL